MMYICEPVFHEAYCTAMSAHNTGGWMLRTMADHDDWYHMLDMGGEL